MSRIRKYVKLKQEEKRLLSGLLIYLIGRYDQRAQDGESYYSFTSDTYADMYISLQKSDRIVAKDSPLFLDLVDLLCTKIVMTMDTTTALLNKAFDGPLDLKEWFPDWQPDKRSSQMVSRTGNKDFGAALIISHYDKALVRALKRKLKSALKTRERKNSRQTLLPFIDMDCELTDSTIE